MAADPGDLDFDSLTTLLRSAQQLAHQIESEPTIRRVLQALTALEPDERDMLAAAIERGVAWRRVNESVSAVNGVRLHVNPNPRLFIRVVDGQEPAVPTAPAPEDVLIAILRVLRRAPIVAADLARAVWEPAATEALAMLTPDERQACRTVGRAAIALIETAIDEADGGESPST